MWSDRAVVIHHSDGCFFRSHFQKCLRLKERQENITIKTYHNAYTVYASFISIYNNESLICFLFVLLLANKCIQVINGLYCILFESNGTKTIQQQAFVLFQSNVDMQHINSIFALQRCCIQNMHYNNLLVSVLTKIQQKNQRVALILIIKSGNQAFVVYFKVLYMQTPYSMQFESFSSTMIGKVHCCATTW